MEKYQHMKSFIAGALEYTRHPSETTISVLQRNLGVIGVSLDLSIFDPGFSIAAEFYVSLHELMNTLGSRTPLIWSALDVLQNACRNTAARQALIHTYKFAPILTRLLETNLTAEKRVRVLKLLQELTYGVKISWQEAHLPYLISTLTQWVMQSKEEDVIALSLGILVNLCYKNLPAVYTLMRTVDTKSFVRMLLNVQSSNINTTVQCCKLMIIMENTNRDISERHILNFVTLTFSSLVRALKDRDVLLLRHIVDFFNDVAQNEHSKNVLLNYKSYATDVENILTTLDGDCDPECITLIMDFLFVLIKLKLNALVPLYPMCVHTAMTWVPVEQVSSKALALIRSVVIDSRRTKSSNDVLAELDLSVLMLVLNTDVNNESEEKKEKRSSETLWRLTELLQLLQEMARTQELRNNVMQAFSEQAMRKMLRPMLEQDDNISAASDWPGNLFNDPTTTLYVHAVAITADLAAHDSAWLTLYSELLQKKPIQMVMALALFTGDGEVKQTVLQLTSSVGFPQECVAAVARSMGELEPLVLVQSATGAGSGPIGRYPMHCPGAEMTPLFSLNQEGRLDTFIAKLEEAFEKNQIADVTTSAVMELYEYKLAAMRHAERATQASLEAANNHATSLQHRLAQIVAESSRLHQLLFYTQQCLEGVRAEKTNLAAKLQTHVTQAQEIPKLKKIVADKCAIIDKSNIVLAQLNKDLEVSKSKEDALSKKVRELEAERTAAEVKTKELNNKKNELSKLVNKMQDNMSKKEKVIEERDREISALEQEITQLTDQCRTYEQTIAEKEENVQRMTAELVDLSRMRDMIYHLTAKKKDDSNTTTT